ncbi:MAG: DUF3108 domain-containing protein [Gammaproteobacteria bacterium]|jgi:hypothetical protein
MKRLITGIVLFLLTAPAMAASLPAPLRPYEAKYILRIDEVPVAKSWMSLRPQKANEYLFRTVTKPMGIVAIFRDDVITEETTLGMVDGTLRPLSIRYSHQGIKHPQTGTARFDWSTRTLTGKLGNEQFSYQDIKPDTDDSFSLQLKIMQAVARGEKQVEFDALEKTKLKHYAFQIVGREKLDTRLGEIETVHVRRIKDKPSYKTDAWYAPKYGYLPVRIRQQHKDESPLVLTIDSYQPL